MQKFNYEGFTSLGQVVKDSIVASDASVAAEMLRDKGIFSQNIVPDGEPMKNVLPGGKSKKEELMFPWQEPAQADVETKINISKDATVQKIVIPEQAWKTNLNSNLKAIEEVFAYYDKNKKKLPKFSESQIKTAKAAATEELLKQAFMRAVKDAL